MKIIKHNPFDIIFCSKDIRRLIILRIKKLGVSPYMLCSHLQVNSVAFESYLNVFNPLHVSTAKNIRQEDILKLANALGIEVSIRLTLKELKDVDVTKFQSEDITRRVKGIKKIFDEKVKEFFE